MAFTIRSFALVVAFLSLSMRPAAQTFGYLGPIGPEFWSDLNPTAWGACSAGAIQSPVNLGHLPVRPHLDITYGITSGEIFNNGHTIEVETVGANSLVLDNVLYELTQFHFHMPSEHRVLSFGDDMEMHLVHTSATGTNAVVAVFLARGASSGPLAPIFAALPDELNVKEQLLVPFNPATFLPRSSAHYRYVGSLTTPPCTEGVQWVVMKDPVTISDEDMAQFAERIHFNARLVQRELPVQPRK